MYEMVCKRAIYLKVVENAYTKDKIVLSLCKFTTWNHVILQKIHDFYVRHLK